MGKSFCKLGGKWCKYCKRDTCECSGKKIKISDVIECPKPKVVPPKLVDIFNKVSYDDIISNIISIWPDQEENKSGYEDAYNEIMKLTPSDSPLTISITHVHEEYDMNFEGIGPEHFVDDYNCVEGVDKDKNTWGISCTEWESWLAMGFTKQTLRSFTDAEIAAYCLYEMTWWGYSQNKVNEETDKLSEVVDDISNIEDINNIMKDESNRDN